jgi:hypothetical protein
VFESKLRPNEPFIDDSNADAHASIAGGLKGWMPRDYKSHPTEWAPFMKRLDVPLIPRSEWAARVEEMERTKTRLSDMCDQVGLPPKNQQQTNYCWINGPTYCAEVCYVAQGNPVLTLSPASVGAKVKGFRNVGGWGAEGLEYMVEHGICTVDVWPANAINRQYDTDAANENRKLHRVTEWYDLKPRSFDELFTCLLLRIPVAVGYSWWSHEVSAIDPVWKDGRPAVRIRNSWGEGYGDRGYAVLAEGKATPDDAVAPRVLTGSAK